MRSMTWALTGLLAIVLSFCEVSPCSADNEISSTDPVPVPAEKLAINADEVSSGVGVRFTERAPDTALEPVSNDFQEQLRVVLEEEEQEIARLRALLVKAPGPMARLELEAQVAERKQQTETVMLQLHLERARAEGRAEDASRIEAELMEILDPSPIIPTTEKRIRASH